MIVGKYDIRILENLTIEVRDTESPNENDAPFLRQDVHPDGRPWENKVEALDWVKNFMLDYGLTLDQFTEEF